MRWLIVPISFAHACLSLCGISMMSSGAQWKWYAM